MWMTSVKLKLNSNIKKTQWSRSCLENLLQKSRKIVLEMDIFDLTPHPMFLQIFLQVLWLKDLHKTELRHRYFPGNFLKTMSILWVFDDIPNVQNICNLIGREEYNIGLLYSLFQYCTLWQNTKTKQAKFDFHSGKIEMHESKQMNSLKCILYFLYQPKALQKLEKLLLILSKKLLSFERY